MPAVDVVLLPLCVGLTLLGIIATGVAWRRGNKRRVVQGVGLALAPIALYFSGLLRLLWNAIVAFGTWASTLIFSPSIWLGHGPARPVHRALGGRRHGRPPLCSAGQGDEGRAPGTSTDGRAAGQGQDRPGDRPQAAGGRPEMAEIEALLKSRGIE